MSASLVERVYSTGFYPQWQRLVTTMSNLVPVAGVDLMAAGAIGALGWTLVAAWRRRGRRGGWRSALDAIVAVTVAVSVLAAWFLASWGLNYRRPPLAARLDHAASRVQAARLRELAVLAVSEVNRLHAPAHARAWPGRDELVPRLRGPFEDALGSLGLPRGVVTGRPKVTLLGPYLVAAGVAGFTNPFTLDIVITPDALGFEQPVMVLHEWGHLAGLAHEAEAGFLAWLAGVRGDEQAGYSAWLDLLPRLIGALDPGEAREVMAGLGEGPRADYRAIRERLERIRPAVRDAAWAGYDQFLQANRVAEGVRSYDGVVTLVAGTAFDEGWRPLPRRAR